MIYVQKFGNTSRNTTEMTNTQLHFEGIAVHLDEDPKIGFSVVMVVDSSYLGAPLTHIAGLPSLPNPMEVVEFLAPVEARYCNP